MLASLTSQFTNTVGQYGVYAVFILMAMDAVLPAGGEIVMLYAGALASGSLAHHATLLGVDLASGLDAYAVLALSGTFGYAIGAIAGWTAGARGGIALIERRGRWLHLGPERMQKAERWFDRFGGRAVFLGRLTPLVRSFVSIPAGVLGSPLRTYIPLTLAGSAVWCFGFAGVGWALGSHYDKAHHALAYLDYAVAAIALVSVAVIARRTLTRRLGRNR